MAVQTMTMTLLEYHPRGKRDELQAWDHLPDGVDMLHKLYGLFKNVTIAELSDAEKSSHVRVLSVTEQGRTVHVRFRVGRGGLSGAVEDSSGSEKYSHGADQTHTIETQILFVAPVGATAIIMFADHVHGYSARTAALKLIQSRWISSYAGSPSHTLQATLLTYGEAWLDGAGLEGVTAYVRDYAADLADGSNSKAVGQVKHELKPRPGDRVIGNGRKLRKKLQNDKSAWGTLLGLADEPDELQITLGDGQHRRTFVLGDDKTPTYRALFADDGQPPLEGNDFIKACRKDVKSGQVALSAAGFTWDDQTTVGPWSAADRSLRWDQVSG